MTNSWSQIRSENGFEIFELKDTSYHREVYGNNNGFSFKMDLHLVEQYLDEYLLSDSLFPGDSTQAAHFLNRCKTQEKITLKFDWDIWMSKLIYHALVNEYIVLYDSDGKPIKHVLTSLMWRHSSLRKHVWVAKDHYGKSENLIFNLYVKDDPLNTF